MKQKVILMVGFFVLGIFFTFPHSAYAQLKPGEPVILGVTAPFAAQLESADALKVATMALEEINAKGGVSIKGVKHPLKIESQDTRDILPGVPVSEALLAVEKVILEKKAHAIAVGPSRSEAFLASMDLAAKYKVPMMACHSMTPVVAKKISEEYNKYKYVFRVGINSMHMAGIVTGMAAFLNKEFGFKKAYLMVQDVLWSRASSAFVESWLQKEGWEVLGKDFFPTGASDFSASLMKAKSTGAQVVIPMFDMPEAGILLKQRNAMKVQAVTAGNIVELAHPEAWKMFGDQIEGCLNTIYEAGNIPVKAMPKTLIFHEAFRKRWGREITIQHGVAPAYDSVYILAAAIERAGSVDPDALVIALEKTDYAGVNGRMRFDKNHEIVYGVNPNETAVNIGFQWQKPGKRVIVYPETVAEGKIQLPPGMKPVK